MEGVLCNSSASEIESDVVSIEGDSEVLDNVTLLSKDTKLQKSLESEEQIKGMNSDIENGPPPLINGGSPTSSEILAQKKYSPTIIGSAIQAVKNLFSPDKAKAKSASALTPVKQERSVPGSPRSTVYVTGKADFFSPDPGMEIFNNVQPASGESNFSNHLQVAAIQSPLFESHNNTDESFLTTASLIDDSFHSAVTHFDELGDTLKTGNNFMDNILNSSQNLDLVDPYNDTLENNESYLENTTLKVGSFSSEGSKMCNVSILDADKNAEILNNTRGLFNISHQSIGSKKERTEEGEISSANIELLSGFPKNGTPVNVHESLALDEREKNEGVDVAHLFLNKSFEDPTKLQKNESETENSSKVANEEELNFVDGTNDEHNMEKNISTTTVVLSTTDSTGFDLLAPIKSDDFGTIILSSGSLGASSSEDDRLGKPSCELNGRVPCKQFASSSSSPATNFSSPSQEKKCVSEGNSPIPELNPIKIKLNKSDELITRRTLGESPRRNRTLQENNSSVDISLTKNSEASEHTETSRPFGKVTKDHQSEIGESQTNGDHASTVPVFSQQSYTILTLDNSLNRPVIEPLNMSKEPHETHTFQTTQSFRTPTANVNKFLEKNSRNASFSCDDVVKPSQLKQSTPIWDGNSESDQKFFRPDALKLQSPDTKKTICDDVSNNFSNEMEISPVNPINDHAFAIEGDMDGSCYSSGFDPDSTGVVQPKVPEELSQTSIKFKISECVSDPRTHLNANHSFDQKLQESSKSVAGKLNETYQKRSPPSVINKKVDSSGHPLNKTFDKNSPKVKMLNSTFTKKRDSEELEKANITFDVLASSDTPQLNKTYDKPELNEAFDKKSESPLMNRTQTLEPPARNQTFIREMENGCPAQEMNKTFDKNEMGGITDALNGRLTPTEDVKEKTSKKIELVNNSDRNERLNSSIHSPFGSDLNPVNGKELNRNSTLIDLSGRLEKFSLEEIQITGTFNDMTDELSDCKKIELDNNKDRNESLNSSNHSIFGAFGEEEPNRNSTVVHISEKLERFSLEDLTVTETFYERPPDCNEDLQNEDKLLISLKGGRLDSDPDIVQLIQEQFSPNDIEKICNVVQDLSFQKLSSNILRASEQFDKSFHGNLSDAEFRPPEVALKPEKPVTALSPQSLDFLNSIRGKPTGRDLSRESLYVKFDPLVQPGANSLIDFTKEAEALATTDSDTSPPNPHSTSICEQLLAISPQKKTDDIVPPLTPLSHKRKTDSGEDNTERLKELQNEIYFLKNLYADREKTNKAKMEDFEGQIAKLTGENCFLEDKLKNSSEREKCLVKKLKEQKESADKLKIIMEEYVKVISKLTTELDALKKENKNQVEALSAEKDAYMTHLNNTEAAFTDVHVKYEKSKKTIASLKENEMKFKNTIMEQMQNLEVFKAKAKEIQEKTVEEFNKIQEELSQTKSSHSQETARLRAQLRKAELKVEALQESLDQKIKENQQLTAICDELIEGKK